MGGTDELGRGVWFADMGRHVLAIALALALAFSPSQDPPTLTWPKPDLFWYSKPVEGGTVWLKVDAEHGVREPLFDHQRLAIELTNRTGIDFTSLTLPFSDPAAKFVVKYDGSNAYIQEGAMAVEFILGSQYWRCDLQIKWDWNRVPPTDYECLPRRPAVAADKTRVTDTSWSVSPDGRWQAGIENHNVVIRPTAGGASVPLTRDGSATFAYQAGSIRWASDSRTVRAYRVSPEVWMSDSLTGRVKDLVSRGEWKVPD